MGQINYYFLQLHITMVKSSSYTFTRMTISGQTVSSPTATCIGSNGVGAVVSTAASIEGTFVYI